MSGEIVYKMTGSGNDFIVVDGRSNPLAHWSAGRIEALCDRRSGVGADGLVVLEPGSASGRVRFHFFNSDGSRASMCGNAALCATRVAAWLELASADGLVLETDAGPVKARCVAGSRELAELLLPATGDLVEPAIELAPGERAIHFTTVGVPHLVVQVDDLAAVPLLERGRALRAHPAVGPSGANVNFIANGSAGWAMRTYERGVEAETLACGTGAVACAAALALGGSVKLPWDVETSSGRRLSVSGCPQAQGRLDSPRLVGEGRLVFHGVLHGI